MSQWRYAHNEQLGAKNGQIVFIESYDDRAGGLTYNATTPYVLPFIDLADGPWIAVMPEGEVAIDVSDTDGKGTRRNGS